MGHDLPKIDLAALTLSLPIQSGGGECATSLADSTA
jgi:hypothetical protein